MGPEGVGGLPDEPRKSRQGVPFDNPGLRTKGGPPDGSRKGWGSQMSPERVQAGGVPFDAPWSQDCPSV